MFNGSFKEVLEEALPVIQSGVSTFIAGEPGHGKSALALMLGDLTGKKTVMIDAMLFEPTDYIASIPNRETRCMETWPGPMLPNPAEAKNTILLIDDLPHAKTFQQTPLLQLIYDKRIGPIQMPGLTVVITGNREEDNAEINPIPSPLMNRCAHFELKQSIDDWIENYAMQRGLHPAVIGYLSSFSEDFSKKPAEGQRGYATPRSWTMLSQVLRSAEAAGELSAGSISRKAQALLGKEVGTRMLGWAKYLSNDMVTTLLENPKEMLSDKADMDRLFAYSAAVGDHMHRTYARGSGEFRRMVPAYADFLSIIPPEYTRVATCYLRGCPEAWTLLGEKGHMKAVMNRFTESMTRKRPNTKNNKKALAATADSE